MDLESIELTNNGFSELLEDFIGKNPQFFPSETAPDTRFLYDEQMLGQVEELFADHEPSLSPCSPNPGNLCSAALPTPPEGQTPANLAVDTNGAVAFLGVSPAPVAKEGISPLEATLPSTSPKQDNAFPSHLATKFPLPATVSRTGAPSKLQPTNAAVVGAPVPNPTVPQQSTRTVLNDGNSALKALNLSSFESLLAEEYSALVGNSQAPAFDALKSQNSESEIESLHSSSTSSLNLNLSNLNLSDPLSLRSSSADATPRLFPEEEEGESDDGEETVLFKPQNGFGFQQGPYMNPQQEEVLRVLKIKEIISNLDIKVRLNLMGCLYGLSQNAQRQQQHQQQQFLMAYLEQQQQQQQHQHQHQQQMFQQEEEDFGEDDDEEPFPETQEEIVAPEIPNANASPANEACAPLPPQVPQEEREDDAMGKKGKKKEKGLKEPKNKDKAKKKEKDETKVKANKTKGTRRNTLPPNKPKPKTKIRSKSFCLGSNSDNPLPPFINLNRSNSYISHGGQMFGGNDIDKQLEASMLEIFLASSSGDLTPQQQAQLHQLQQLYQLQQLQKFQMQQAAMNSSQKFAKKIPTGAPFVNPHVPYSPQLHHLQQQHHQQQQQIAFQQQFLAQQQLQQQMKLQQQQQAYMDEANEPWVPLPRSISAPSLPGNPPSAIPSVAAPCGSPPSPTRQTTLNSSSSSLSTSSSCLNSSSSTSLNSGSTSSLSSSSNFSTSTPPLNSPSTPILNSSNSALPCLSSSQKISQIPQTHPNSSAPSPSSSPRTQPSPSSSPRPIPGSAAQCSNSPFPPSPESPDCVIVSPSRKRGSICEEKIEQYHFNFCYEVPDNGDAEEGNESGNYDDKSPRAPIASPRKSTSINHFQVTLTEEQVKKLFQNKRPRPGQPLPGPLDALVGPQGPVGLVGQGGGLVELARPGTPSQPNYPHGMLKRVPVGVIGAVVSLENQPFPSPQKGGSYIRPSGGMGMGMGVGVGMGRNQVGTEAGVQVNNGFNVRQRSFSMNDCAFDVNAMNEFARTGGLVCQNFDNQAGFPTEQPEIVNPTKMRRASLHDASKIY